MTNTDRFSACMRQAEFAASRFDARRQYEWKVTLGLWALLAGAIGFLRGQPLPWWVGTSIVPVIVFGHAFLWLRGVWVGHENDKAMAFHFRMEAEKVLLDPNYVPSKSPEKIRGWRWFFGFLFHWATLFQFLATAILGWLVYMLI